MIYRPPPAGVLRALLLSGPLLDDSQHDPVASGPAGFTIPFVFSGDGPAAPSIGR